jgi:D-alanyl-D-alanine dipeptidase
VNARFAMAGILLWSFISLWAGPGWGGNADRFVDVQTMIPSIALDIRYYGDHNFVGTRVDGYLAPKCLLAAPAAEALAKVQADLQEFSLSLKVYDCYRPQRAVDHFVRWASDIPDTKTKAEFYPTVDKRNLFRDGYIAEKSSHSRGSTVDVTIVPFPAPAGEKYVPGQPLRTRGSTPRCSRSRPAISRQDSASGIAASTWGRGTTAFTSSRIPET